MTSSALVRISPGSTRVTRLSRSSTLESVPYCALKAGCQYLQKASPRPTSFSYNLLWLSWTAVLHACPAGVPSNDTPCSYMPCPVSWMVLDRLSSGSEVVQLVVILASPAAMPVVNGWIV